VLGLGSSRRHVGRAALLLLLLAAAAMAWLLEAGSVGHATSGGDPYSTPLVADTNPDPNIVETTLTAQTATVDIGNGVMAHAETFNGAIPGPTFQLKVGDTVIVHFKNNLSVPTGIHWHGIELSNEMDGTPFTQQQVPPGGSFLYKFKVTRPGIFWYHPHHHSSTNQVFAGMYGMIVVADPNAAALQAAGTLPPADQTKQIVLSDTTVCKAAGTNDTDTYPNRASQGWVSNANGAPPTPVQLGPTPKTLCETPSAIDQDGNTLPTSYAAGDIPAIQQNAAGQENEGQTVLTNGKNVGARAGYPASPGALAAGASTLNVRPGQGLRLQMVNASAIRYMRLHLTTDTGTDVPLLRVGGEGGLLDSAVLEGNTQPVPSGTFDTGYVQGEILLAPGSRADVVAAIPASATGVLTMWTEDYSRTGKGFSDIPTVPVMHLQVAGTPVSPAYAIADGTPLRAATGDLVPVLGSPTGTLLNPATFSPPKVGSASSTISFTAGANKVGVDNVTAIHDVPNYETAPHLGSTRYAKVGDTLELMVTNATAAHHPFHLHGFSIQPIDLTETGQPTYMWPYHEFRDNVDIPPGYTLRFRVRIDDRPLPDGTTPGGALGRWLFHCHIFFHAELGMLSELVVVPPSGKERPDINVDTTQVNVTQGQKATVTGTYFDVDGEPVTLSSSVGSVHDGGGGRFTWSLQTGTTSSQFVYLTATNTDGSKGQIPFFLNVTDAGPPTITVPGPQRAQKGAQLRFGISAGDPNPFAPLTLGASGLPGGLRFTDNHNRTGLVSGTVTARPGVYNARFTAGDGSHPPASGTVRITITPAELALLVGRRVHLSGGAIAVECKVLHATLRTCTVTALVGRKRIGSAAASLHKRGTRTLTIKIKLNAGTLRTIGHSRKGVTVTIVLQATEFGSKTRLSAQGQTTVLPAAKRR